MIFYIVFTLNLQSQCIFFTYSTSQLKLALCRLAALEAVGEVWRSRRFIIHKEVTRIAGWEGSLYRTVC